MSLNASNRGNYVDSALFLSPPGNWGGVVGSMKPGSHLLLFSSVKEHHIGAIAAEDAGLEIRDTLAWVFSDESNDTAMQLIAMARKPLQGTVAENTLKYGTGGINVDKCRIGLQPEEDVEKLNKRSGGTRGFGSASVYGEGTTGPGTDLSKGRWPANLILQDCPTVREMFPLTKSGKDVNPTSNSVKGFFSQSMSYYSKEANYGDEGSAARFFYAAPTLNTLINYLLKLVTPPGGTVLTSPQDFDLVEKSAKGESFTVLRQDD